MSHIREQKEKRQPIPDMYQNRNVLRYEQRHKGRLPKTFNVERVTAAMLFDEAFHIKVIDKWNDNCLNIRKINDKSFNFEAMKTKTDLYNMGVLALIGMHGGELNVISQIKSAGRGVFLCD